MTLMDPVVIAYEALVYAGFTDVHPNGPAEQNLGIQSRAVSADRYIWIEEEVGTTPHIRYSDRPSIRVIVYSKLGVAEATSVGRQVSRALLDAQGVPLPSGGIHRVITQIRPHREDLVGLPPGTGRSSALYDLVLSTVEKWE